ALYLSASCAPARSAEIRAAPSGRDVFRWIGGAGGGCRVGRRGHPYIRGRAGSYCRLSGQSKERGLQMKVFLIVLAGLVLTQLFAKKSAALRHWVLALTMLCALMMPALEVLVPAWHLPVWKRVVVSS